MKVILKPTTFRADEILFRATSPGGTSLASDKDYIPASTATQVITAGGIGKFNAIDLRKFMTGKIASAGPFIGELEEGLSGSSSRKDLETDVSAHLSQVHAAEGRRHRFQCAGGADENLPGEPDMQSPEFAFFEALTAARYQNHFRRRLATAATVDEWNLDKSLAFYKDRFADASDFTFRLRRQF